MHDVTEGGFATAVREVAAACRRDVVVDLDSVPVFALTRRIGELLGIDPLGLIGSGSLLISCSQDYVGGLLEACAERGIEATVVGGFTEGEGAATAVRSGRPAELPAFAVDEAARVLS